MQFVGISSTTPYARYTADYNFLLLARQNILDYELGGVIFIDFPSNFIIDVYQSKCSVDQTFSFFSNCIKENNRFFLNATNNLWDPSSKGQLNITINSVRSPDNVGDTPNFVISNYNNKSQKILGRTYFTLNKANLNFVLDGLQIFVNENQKIELEVGSYSNWYKIRMDSPATQSLTLSPSLIDNTIIVDPFPLIFELGQTELSFRLAAPRTILLYSYYITWSKTGDSYPVTYAPLVKTRIDMVKGTIKQVIYVEYLYYIPQNGTTYPLLLFTKNPPYKELIVNITFTINPTTGRFLNGTNENNSFAFLSDSQFNFTKAQESVLF